MRLTTALVTCLLLAACDSQGPGTDHPIVGSWVMDSTGTAEVIVPASSGPLANFAMPSIAGEAVFDGDVSGRLHSGIVANATPGGAREARFASYDLAGEEPTPFFVLTVSGDETSSVFQLFEQRATESSRTYVGYLDGPPFTIDGDQIVLPAAELYRYGGGRPPLQFRGGAFTFPTVALTAGEAVTIRRDAQPDTNPALDIRYVFEADGGYRIEGVRPSDQSPLSEYEAGRWEADGDLLLLTRGLAADGHQTRFTYTRSGDRLVLHERLSGCEGRQECLENATGSLALPPGSVTSYERFKLITLHR